MIDRADREASDALTNEQVEFIEASSLVFVMSGAPDAPPDVSPRGDAPGFVRVVDRRLLQLPDRVGNNRVDTIRNVVQDPHVSLVFTRAGDNRILIVEGIAVSRTDPDILDAHIANERRPRSVMEINVTSAGLGESPAIAISNIWKPDAVRRFEFSLGAALTDQIEGLADTARTEELVANDYRSRLY